jgi:hypothetical protein
MTVALLLYACTEPTDDSADDSDSAPTAPRFHVTGRLDGERFRVHCDADTLPDELLAKVSGGTAFTAQCTDADSEKMVQVWSIEGTTGDWHACGATHGAWLLTPWTPPRA